MASTRQPKNELVRIVEKYFPCVENTVHFFGKGDVILETARFFRHLVQYDHPDAYSVIGDEILIFEHFEFDSSSNKARGSLQRRAEAADKREFRKVVPTEEGSVYHSQIDADYSMQNYIDNATRVFSEHYCKIADYKRALKTSSIFQPNMSARVLFFIEDTTLLGNIFETDSWENPSGGSFDTANVRFLSGFVRKEFRSRLRLLRELGTKRLSIVVYC